MTRQRITPNQSVNGLDKPITNPSDRVVALRRRRHHADHPGRQGVEPGQDGRRPEG